MVNKILKCVGVLGEWDRVIIFWQSGVRCGAAMAVLSAALLGCSNTESLSPQTKIETKAEAPKSAAAEEFTTKGKPTKTIETPSGPKEVYDPLQDEEVKQAFADIYNQNDPNFRLVYCCKKSSYTGSAKILRRAMQEQINSYKALSCQTVRTSQCGTWFSDLQCRRNQSCAYTLMEANGGYYCSVGDNEQVFDISRFPIGEHSKNNLPNRNYNEQFENLFLIHCQSYGE